MKRAVMHLLAGLAGFVIGWALTTSPMAWGLAGTRVTWDGSTCPEGIYTITSMARSADNGRTHVTSSSSVTLPSPAVTQEFSGLPAGAFSVTAVARRTDGLAFESIPQTLVSAGDGVVVTPTPTPTPTPPATAPIRQRPRGNNANSQAQARGNNNRNISISGAPNPHTAAAPAQAQAQIETTGKTNAASSIQISKADLEYIRIQLNDVVDSAGPDSGWRRVSLLDSNADGLTDVILVEMNNGDVRVWQLNR